MYFSTSALAAILPLLVAAGAPPNHPGMSVVWSDDFSGAAGDEVNGNLWNIAQAIDTNDELQSYTTSSRNLQLSGGNTVQMVPWKAPNGAWTSGRIESKGTFTPNAGKIMQIEGSIRTGGNTPSQSAGMWPAFWLLGDSMRHGTSWPTCGELDIFERVNGGSTVYGTAHCNNCNQPIGRQGTTSLDDGWHTYGVKIDRTPSDWTQETITWYADGQTFQTLTGASIGDQGIWATLAHSPLYMLINVAVGGDWPGAPNSATLDGYGSMLEVDYVAVYTT